MKHRIATVLVSLLAASVLLIPLGCNESDADIAAKNLSKAAEQFEVPRRIVFINGITDKYLYSIEGYCSVETESSGLAGALEVTCRDGDDEKATFKKYFFGLADNVTYSVEQMEGTSVSTNRVRVIFKPETIVPDFDRP